MLKRTTAVLSAVAIVFASGAAVAALGSASRASVTFDASGPAGLKIQGTAGALTVSEDAGQMIVTVPLAGLTTGIALRDKHMREKYLEVNKFPDVVLRVPRASLKFPTGAAATGDAAGTLTLHGVTKPVNVHYTAKPASGAVDIEGAAHINMNDFGIRVPSYLGVTVKPEVDVNAKFRATDN